MSPSASAAAAAAAAALLQRSLVATPRGYFFFYTRSQLHTLLPLPPASSTSSSSTSAAAGALGARVPLHRTPLPRHLRHHHHPSPLPFPVTSTTATLLHSLHSLVFNESVHERREKSQRKTGGGPSPTVRLHQIKTRLLVKYLPRVLKLSSRRKIYGPSSIPCQCL